MSSAPPPADWYPDPMGRYQQRYWDGSAWTEHVATNGQAAVDPMAARPAVDDVVPVGTDDATKVQRQVIGRIVQQNMIGKIRFSMEAGGQQVGSLNAENWRAWNFHVADTAGVEVARITKTWEGLAKAVFTTADNYVVQIHRPLEDPLRSLVVASALCVDTALKQDSRGFG